MAGIPGWWTEVASSQNDFEVPRNQIIAWLTEQHSVSR